jgi:hypothetical protein
MKKPFASVKQIWEYFSNYIIPWKSKNTKTTTYPIN